MNENIIKLLRSLNKEDNIIGFELLRKECKGHPNEMNKALVETNLRIVKASANKYRLYRIHWNFEQSSINLY